jgi:hypothetical protein
MRHDERPRWLPNDVPEDQLIDDCGASPCLIPLNSQMRSATAKYEVRAAPTGAPRRSELDVPDNERTTAPIAEFH